MDPAFSGAFVAVAAIVMGTACAIFIPLVRAYARRVGGAGTTIPTEVTARLERMEQSLEAIAVEIERITEGQRFTTKLLSERVPPASGVGLPASAASPPGERRS